MIPPIRKAGDPGPDLDLVAAKDFDRLVAGTRVPVIVAFTADWCAPCAWLKPYLYAIMAQVGAGVRVVAVDVDEAPEVAERFGIRSVPTVLLLRDGVEADRSVGVEPERLQGWTANAAGGTT